MTKQKVADVEEGTPHAKKAASSGGNKGSKKISPEAPDDEGSGDAQPIAVAPQPRRLSAKIAELLHTLKLNKKVFDADELKLVETINLRSEELLKIQVPQLSILSLHVLYDKLSKVWNLNELENILEAYELKIANQDDAASDLELAQPRGPMTFDEFVTALRKNKHIDNAILRGMKAMLLGLLTRYHGMGCPTPSGLTLDPESYLSLASPFLNNRLHELTTADVKDFLLIKRQIRGVTLRAGEGSSSATATELCRAMDLIDKWVETRPAMQRFLDPPCFFVEPIGGGGDPGVAATVATLPAVHGVAPMADGVAGGSWDQAFTSVSREAAVAAATAVRARHPGPNGAGGAVLGANPCRVIAFNMTAAGYFEI